MFLYITQVLPISFFSNNFYYTKYFALSYSTDVMPTPSNCKPDTKLQSKRLKRMFPTSQRKKSDSNGNTIEEGVDIAECFALGNFNVNNSVSYNRKVRLFLETLET